MGCYGYGRATTPRLDELATESVLFENASSQAAYTLPSMASVFTALDPIAHGLRSHPDRQGRGQTLSGDLETLPEKLKAAGYSTGAVISNSLFQRRFKGGFEAGFDRFDVGKRRRDAGPTSDIAIEWLGELFELGQPFFLWVHYIDPHWPYDPPAGFARPFACDDGGEYARLLIRFLEGSITREAINFDPPLSERGISAGICAYDNEIAYADGQIGRLLDRLRRLGLAESTLVVVISDHGEALGDHGLTFAHSFTLYDEIERVPLIVKPPGAPRGVRVRQPVRLLDVAPTICEILGLDPVARGQGRSLCPLWIEGEGALPAAPAYAESELWTGELINGLPPQRRRQMGTQKPGRWHMIRQGDFKLIWVPGRGGELYDLAQDPGERVNLITDPPPAAASLARIMKEHLDRSSHELAVHGTGLTENDRAALEEILRAMGY